MREGPFSFGERAQEVLLGAVRPEAQISIFEYRERRAEGDLRYINPLSAMNIARAHQPAEIKNPSDWPREKFPLVATVQSLLAESLDVKDVARTQQIRIFTAGFSRFDIQDSDAWVELDVEEGGGIHTFVVGLDITTSEVELKQKQEKLGLIEERTDGKIMATRLIVPFLWPREADPEDTKSPTFNKTRARVSVDLSDKIIDAFMAQMRDNTNGGMPMPLEFRALTAEELQQMKARRSKMERPQIKLPKKQQPAYY
jgi:hypothetical protein